MPPFSRFVLMVILLQLFALISHAEPVNADTGTNGKASDTQVKFYTETNIIFTDNLFCLSETQKEKLESPDTEDETNGRFSDMESVSDIILVPMLGADLKLETPFEGDLFFSPSLKYNIHFQNPAVNFPEAKVEMKYIINKNSHISLEFEWLGGCFKKNYMSEVNDLNENGNISKDERIYSAAVYDEYEGAVAYKHTLLKHKKDLISKMEVEPFVGWNYRIYNSTFSNRNKRTFGGGVSVEVELLSRLSIDATYTYEGVRTRNDNELVLFDETLYGIDANNDGEIADHAALMTPIDRSCNVHSVEITQTFELTNIWKFFLGLEYEWSYYQSNNELDIDHYNLWSLSKELKAGFVYDISKKWSVQLEYNTSEDDTVEEDYTENCFMATVKCRMDKWSPWP